MSFVDQPAARDSSISYKNDHYLAELRLTCEEI